MRNTSGILKPAKLYWGWTSMGMVMAVLNELGSRILGFCNFGQRMATGSGDNELGLD